MTKYIYSPFSGSNLGLNVVKLGVVNCKQGIFETTLRVFRNFDAVGQLSSLELVWRRD